MRDSFVSVAQLIAHGTINLTPTADEDVDIQKAVHFPSGLSPTMPRKAPPKNDGFVAAFVKSAARSSKSLVDFRSATDSRSANTPYWSHPVTRDGDNFQRMDVD